jgi:HK97 family phage prohead protease
MSVLFQKTVITDFDVNIEEIDVEAIENKGYTQKFKITDETPDLAGDVVRSDGLDTSQYVRNPVVLWEHKKTEMPVGTAKKLYKEDDGWYADIYFPPKKINEHANNVAKAVAAGLIRGTSITYRTNRNHIKKADGVNFVTKSSLSEISITNLPMNYNALSKSKSEESMEQEMFNDLKESILKEISELRQLVTQSVESSKSENIQVVKNEEPKQEVQVYTKEQISEMIKEQVSLALQTNDKGQKDVTQNAAAVLTMTEEDLQKIVDESFKAGAESVKN